MHSFRDSEGRPWNLAINVSTVKRVRSLVGVDLYRLPEDGFKPLGELLGDPCKFVDVLFAIVKPDADAKEITDESFGAALGGDYIEKASDAFVEELIDFFPDERRRKALRKVIEKGKAIGEKLMDRAEATILRIDPDREATQIVDRLTARSSNVPSGNTPAS